MVTSLSTVSPASTRSACKSPSCVQLLFCAFLAALLIHEVLSCYAISSSCGILWRWRLPDAPLRPAHIFGEQWGFSFFPVSWGWNRLNFLGSAFDLLFQSLAVLSLVLPTVLRPLREILCCLHPLLPNVFFCSAPFSIELLYFNLGRRSGVIWGPGSLPHWYHPFWL